MIPCATFLSAVEMPVSSPAVKFPTISLKKPPSPVELVNAFRTPPPAPELRPDISCCMNELISSDPPSRLDVKFWNSPEKHFPKSPSMLVVMFWMMLANGSGVAVGAGAAVCVVPTGEVQLLLGVAAGAMVAVTFEQVTFT